MIKIRHIITLCALAIAINSIGCIADSKSTSTSEDEIVIGGGACGNNVCTGKTFCCNASCGVCAPIGGGCTDVVCETEETTAAPAEEAAAASAEEPASALEPIPGGPIVIQPGACGANTCTGNTHCCNASCGTCVGPGGECTQQICSPTT